MRARIYLKPKSAMQSGRAGSDWELHYISDAPEKADRLMGWISGGIITQGPAKGQPVPYLEGGSGGVRRAQRHRLRPGNSARAAGAHQGVRG